MEKKKKIIQKTTKELFKLLEIEGDITVGLDDEMASIVLSTEDSGIVIGRHGDMLESLQTILALCVSKKLDKFYRISLEVGDYKKNREEWLRSMVIDTKDRVLSENREITIPSLKAWERRIVHLSLSDDKEVVSESIGEGKDRVLLIRPKN
ncbi:MAG: R3H domain-containing nucleic acid-binding protein [Patescibacteria group bacterium]